MLISQAKCPLTEVEKGWIRRLVCQQIVYRRISDATSRAEQVISEYCRKARIKPPAPPDFRIEIEPSVLRRAQEECAASREALLAERAAAKQIVVAGPQADRIRWKQVTREGCSAASYTITLPRLSFLGGDRC